jgi:hypothetical protein
MRGLALSLMLASGSAAAEGQFQIWDVQLGAPVTQIPVAAMAEVYCGTNGGPPSVPLPDVTDFARCPTEPDGLHEVGFTYDDEAAYVARAMGSPHVIQTIATRVFGQPAVVSVLVDVDGVVQGLRIVTDDRAPDILRRRAHALATQFEAQFHDHNLHCADLPLADGEQPLGHLHVKTRCTGVSADKTQTVQIEASYLRRKGQTGVDMRSQRVNTGYYESRTRLELRLRAAGDR